MSNVQTTEISNKASWPTVLKEAIITTERSDPRRPRHTAMSAHPAISAVWAAAVILGGLGLPSAGVMAQTSRPPAKISEEQATQAALRALPGKVTDITIEKKRGKNVYVVEVVSEKDGAETDVLVDLESGQVVGLDR